MAAGIITAIGRKKLCEAHAGDAVLSIITKMAFGEAGISAEGEVISPTGEEVSLRAELLQLDIDSHSNPIPTTCRYSVRLSKEVLPNKHISELGLVDADGDLIAYKTFLPKGKDEDMELVFEMDEIF